MLAKREWQILKLLTQHQDFTLTGELLAKELSITSRTLRKSIVTLSEGLQNSGARLERKRGQGYQLILEDKYTFYQFLQNEEEFQEHSFDARRLETPKDREHYILNRLFFEEVYLTVDQLTQELFVSRATVLACLNSLRQQLKQYDIQIVAKHNKGLTVEGPEEKQRRFLIGYFFPQAKEADFISQLEADNILEEISLEDLTILVWQVCRQNNVRMSDYAIQNLVLHIALSFKRLKTNRRFEFDYSTPLEPDEHSYQVAREILTQLEERFAIIFPEAEAKYISLHLMGKSHGGQKPKVQAQLQSEIQACLSRLSDIFELPLTKDTALLQGLIAHFTPLLIRLESQIVMENPMLEDLREHYGSELIIVKEAFVTMPLLASYSINDDEWAYIALHVISSVQRLRQDGSKRVLVICATGYGSAQMLMNRLQHLFARQLDIVDVISYYELADVSLDGIDLVLSTVNLDAIMLPVPVLQVNALLLDDDINKIQRFLNLRARRNTDISKKAGNSISSEAVEIFDSVFDSSQFVVVQEARMIREDILELALDRITDVGLEDFKSHFKNQLAMREQLGSVVFQEHYAFPHPSVSIGLKTEIVVVLTPNGLIWDQDHQDVRFTALISPSKQDAKALKYISPSFVQWMEDPLNLERLSQCPTFETFRLQFLPFLNAQLKGGN
ncbi:BglG family transcription antiterminator [Streptococcus moroccensis]|uniref:Lichenan operon transcriptional antiterminator n=1 Tax=Streptococcus moroccensis TaxID=1451356 RepID=A0ABT9YUN9_9STRE|nr:PRD domain-containing protein [Streptococcus moroccensis]MDQ0222815.1 lichenan operon transcriptional antiterminator [Streptococcus moroccensis]